MKKKDLLDKWLNDELTPEEFEVFRTLPEFSSYQKIDSFVKSIDLPRPDREITLKELKLKLKDANRARKPKVRSLPFIYKVAAILVLAIASYFFISNLEVSHRTDIAVRLQFELPDRSQVQLNNDSRISYKKFKWNSNRSLALEGEAFFEVEEGETFSVVTDAGIVTVLGTKFNVYSRGDSMSVSCFEGLVRLTKGEVSIELTEGRTAGITNGELELGQTYVSRPGWLYNESAFEDIALRYVIEELEKQYDISIITENIDVNLRFSGSFPNDDLEAALQAVTLPFNLNYRIDNKNVVTISGAYGSE